MIKKFGSATDYLHALRTVEAEGIPGSHRDLLRAHFAAPDHTVSWRELAPSVGYPSAEPVKLQYGKFARRIAEHLGVTKQRAHGFWLNVLADWGPHLDPKGHMTFRLRPQLVSALKRLGWVEGAVPPSLLETDDSMVEGRTELRRVAHRRVRGSPTSLARGASVPRSIDVLSAFGHRTARKLRDGSGGANLALTLTMPS